MNPAVRQKARAAARVTADKMIGGKQDPADVNYRDASSPDKRCGVCQFFSDGTCSKVAGTIYPDAVCNLFKANLGGSSE